MNRDLYLAILAMDSYNRGYDRGLKFTVNESASARNEAGSRLGNAQITVQSNISATSPDFAAGFYGIAYDMSGVEGFGWGETVIAYRGTDNMNLGGFVENLLWGTATESDLATGYGIALGHPDGVQARLAGWC